MGEMSASFVINRWIEGHFERIRNQRIVKASHDSLAAAGRNRFALTSA
jgi:hypothetical protein